MTLALSWPWWLAVGAVLLAAATFEVGSLALVALVRAADRATRTPPEPDA